MKLSSGRTPSRTHAKDHVHPPTGAPAKASRGNAGLNGKFIRPSNPIGGSTIYTVDSLRMDIKSMINSAERTGAKNAATAGPANISGL